MDLIPPNENTLALISEARHALAEAQTLPDIRRVMEEARSFENNARAAAHMARGQQMATDVVKAAEAAANDAAAIRIEAQAKAGEILRQMAERGQRVDAHGGATKNESQPTTRLDDLGVTKSASSRWQRVADIPEPVRHEYVQEVQAEEGEVTTSGLLHYASAQAERTISDAATESDDSHRRLVVAELRKRVADVIHACASLSSMQAENAAEFMDAERVQDPRPYIEGVLRWLDQIDNARRPFHVVGGENQ